MKISKQTLAILKNFAQINNSIIIDESFILKTGTGGLGGSNRASILAVADIQEDFKNICVYDLNKLLSSINMFNIDEMDLSFNKSSIMLQQGHRRVTTPMSDINIIPFPIKYTSDVIKNPKIDYNATFNISNDSLRNIKNAANIFKAQEKHLKIVIENGNGTLKVTNFANSSSDMYTETFKVDKKANASIVIDLNDFTLIEGDYEVSICDSRLLKLFNKDLNLTYQLSAMLIQGE